MENLHPGNQQSARRHFLASSAMNVSSLALAWMLNHDRAAADGKKPDLQRQTFDTTPKTASTRPQATGMISLWMHGAFGTHSAHRLDC
jgi:hypothetical protein